MRRIIAHLALVALPSLAAACTAPAWQEPTATNSAICDAAYARADVGRPSSLDTRPRPECRTAIAAPQR